MKRLTLICGLLLTMFCVSPCSAQMLVYDATSNMTDIMDNLVDVLDMAEQIENTYMQLESMYEQIQQADEYAERFGDPSELWYVTRTLDYKKVKRQVEKQSAIIKRTAKSTDNSIVYTADLYKGVKVSALHAKSWWDGDEKEKNKEKFVAEENARNAAQRGKDTLQKEIDKIQKENQSLAEAASKAETLTEIAKINAMLAANDLQLAFLHGEQKTLDKQLEYHRIQMDMYERQEKMRNRLLLDEAHENAKKWKLQKGSRTIRQNVRDIMRIKL